MLDINCAKQTKLPKTKGVAIRHNGRNNYFTVPLWVKFKSSLINRAKYHLGNYHQSDYLLGNSCSLGLPWILNVICLFLTSVISHLGYGSRISVLIVPVPDH